MSNVKGVELRDLSGLSQPLTKLIECVSCGIGKVYEPTHIRRMARARASEIRLISAAVNENINLPSVYAQGDITIDASQADELMKRTGNRWLFQEMQKQQNIESVVGVAYSELEKESIVSEEQVDKDWILRFFNSVEDISNEEMQRLWGRILAGEIKQPYSLSLRTLDVLHNISQSEAILFQHILSFALYCGNNVFIPNVPDINEKYFQFSDLLHLSECGLLVVQTFLGLDAKLDDEQFIYNNINVCKITPDYGTDINVRLEGYFLTDVGRQLFGIIEKQPNGIYSLEYYSHLKSKASGYTVSAYEVYYINGDTMSYDDHDLL